ncbi:hypothetical protein Ate02nite_09940 [Paractinoplanes tereljensis]|uniref:Uncharacterized protein n=1 Tax=Paractinoplanes tereljensis TaxID=571912 RepID=A0A919NGN2_9ACTN|nr:hypothetical protein Ate02nite_09940 [Actinoplanes tereljensis]
MADAEAEGAADTGAAATEVAAEGTADDETETEEDGETEGDEDENQPLAPAGRTNAAAATAAATPMTTPSTAKRRAGDPGLRCPLGASFVLISAGLYWARSHGVILKIFGEP